MSAPARDREDVLLRQVFAAHPTGVVAVAAMTPDGPVGMAASSFVPVSLDPPLVSVCVAHTSSTWPVLRRRPNVGISVLAAGHESVCRQLAAKGVDRFAGIPWRAHDSGAVLVEDAPAWFDCTVEQVVSAGDHDIVVLRIVDRDVRADLAPLVFHASTYRTVG